jgi:ATPase subunit of ABC transporter with duplicated ATPase domains
MLSSPYNPMYLNAQNLAYIIQDNLILKDVSVAINMGDKIALIGNNGSGKTTLLKILNRELKPTDGTVEHKGVIYYLAQLDFALLNTDQTLFEYLSNKLDDWWDVLVKLEEVFNIELNPEIRLNSLSGGELMKINLALALHYNPDILLLDEATNHLDIPSRDVLKEFLQKFDRAFVLSSHDAFFIDQVANKVWEMEDKTVKVYGGNYTAYKAQKQAIFDAQARQYELARKKANKLEESLRKEDRRADLSFKKGQYLKSDRSMARSALGYFKNRASFTAGRNAERLIRQISRAREDLSKHKFQSVKAAYLDLKEAADKTNRRLISLKGADLHILDQVVIKDIFFNLHYGDRVVVTGANGSGKTSFIKALLSHDPAYKLEGKNVLVEDFKSVYVSQNYNVVDPEKTLVENVVDFNPGMNYETVRRQLGNFLFFSDYDVKKRAKILSGGEVARLVLAMVTAAPIDLLILDEPTNNLDLFTINIIIDALKDFRGAILVISHNVDFLSKIEIKKAYAISDQKLNEMRYVPAKESQFYDELLGKITDEPIPDIEIEDQDLAEDLDDIEE